MKISGISTLARAAIAARTGCRRDYYTDESLCLAKYCEDYPTAEGCEQEKGHNAFCVLRPGQRQERPLSPFVPCARRRCGVLQRQDGRERETDGTLIREQDGTCAQNGFESGIFGGSSADSTQPEQQSADVSPFSAQSARCVTGTAATLTLAIVTGRVIMRSAKWRAARAARTLPAAAAATK